ncbi:hypothetical protein DFA_06278 [Cavenderia fasciculata]|uniref:Uncharacterized protein n=1 Tax=Cavenderia fasciculata TaxID=261658 RepID=F4PKL1_CACFS|nr:uncharacterized protein DFA_06278 [Cavenderia fasciculata]EGG24135.1 hypothetical protein DFA_06278 [Cavenderia fasciculata]|eukprot:XP_004361986.1 hypothetical protein DFA_06278 [Cavenderia fasciculata]
MYKRIKYIVVCRNDPILQKSAPLLSWIQSVVIPPPDPLDHLLDHTDLDHVLDHAAIDHTLDRTVSKPIKRDKSLSSGRYRGPPRSMYSSDQSDRSRSRSRYSSGRRDKSRSPIVTTPNRSPTVTTPTSSQSSTVTTPTSTLSTSTTTTADTPTEQKIKAGDIDWTLEQKLYFIMYKRIKYIVVCKNDPILQKSAPLLNLDSIYSDTLPNHLDQVIHFLDHAT